MTVRGRAGFSAVVAAAALLGGALVVNCSKATDRGGVVRLALQIPPGYTIGSVHWEIISAAGSMIEDGYIDTGDAGSPAPVDTSCPAGTGYAVVTTALATTTAGGSVACNGTSNTFNLGAGGSVMVGLTLVCGGGDPPTTHSDVNVPATGVAGDACPRFTTWGAVPVEATTGGTIAVSATATDSDAAARGQTLMYVWTASSGTFANANAASTSYICGSPTLSASHARLGPPIALAVKVSDGVPACDEQATFNVDCVAADP